MSSCRAAPVRKRLPAYRFLTGWLGNVSIRRVDLASNVAATDALR